MLRNDRDPMDVETLDLLHSVEGMAGLGVPVSVDPDVAEAMGAFVEDAIDPDDAIASLFDPEDLEPQEEELGHGED